MRTHTSANSAIILDKEYFKNKRPGIGKPRGFWYGFDNSWIDWCESEDFGYGPYLHEVIIKDESKILRIQSIEEFDLFEKEYQYRIGLGGKAINWDQVAEKYSGCELNPYLYKKRFSSSFYYGWDVASGCIWDLNLVELIFKGKIK